VAAAADGALLQALALYALLAVQALAAMALAGLAARMFYEGELESGGQAPAQLPAARAAPGAGGLAGLFARWGLPPVVVALMRREQTYLWRDPAVKLQLMQSLFATLYLAFAVVMLNFRHASELPQGWLNIGGKYILLGLALMLGLSESSVLFNRFGYEGGQLASLLVTPVSRRTLLAAKSIFLVSHFVVLNMLLCLGLGIALHAPPQYIVLAVVLVLANTLLLDVIGYFVSIHYPFAYRRAGRRMRAVMPQPGCGYVLVYLLVFNLCNLIAFPVSAVSALCVIFLGWPGLLLAVVWSGGIAWAAYYFALPQAAQHLEQREPQLLAALSKGSE
jgi:hypothetical protein